MPNKSNVAIQETFKLPSNGRLYAGMNIPTEVTLRAMSTLDEKIRLASTNPFKVTPKLVRNCIEGEDFDTEDLKLFDLYFLTFKLREITYGSDYKVNVTCRNCGSNQKVIVDLSSLDVTELTEEDMEPFTIDLPVSGDHLNCKFLSCKDINRLQAEVDRIASKNPELDETDVGFIPGLCTRIVDINGEVKPQPVLVQYMQNMHAKDYNYFDKKYTEITNKPGLDLSYSAICEKCGRPILFEVPMLQEFFSPL